MEASFLFYVHVHDRSAHDMRTQLGVSCYRIFFFHFRYQPRPRHQFKTRKQTVELSGPRAFASSRIGPADLMCWVAHQQGRRPAWKGRKAERFLPKPWSVGFKDSKGSEPGRKEGRKKGRAIKERWNERQLDVYSPSGFCWRVKRSFWPLLHCRHIPKKASLNSIWIGHCVSRLVVSQ